MNVDSLVHRVVARLCEQDKLEYGNNVQDTKAAWEQLVTFESLLAIGWEKEDATEWSKRFTGTAGRRLGMILRRFDS